MAEFGRNLQLMAFIYLLSSLAGNIIVPVWSLYILSLGSSMKELGFVFSISNAVSAALFIPMGLISDKYGRRKMHVLGSFLAVFPPFFYALAGNWLGLIPWVILAGGSFGITWPIRWTIVADEAEAKTMGKSYSWINVAMVTGSILGPLVGGVIADYYGIRIPFFTCFLFLLSVFLLSLLTWESKREKPQTTSQKPEDKAKEAVFYSVMFKFAMLNVILSIGIGIVTPITPVFMVKRFSVDYAYVGLLYSVGSGFASLIVQIPGGRLADKYDRKKIMIIGLTLAAPFQALFALSRSVWELFIFMFLSKAFFQLALPSWQAILQDLTPSTKWGLMNGISAAGAWAGAVIGSALSGFVWDTFGMFIPYYIAGLTMFLCITPILFVKDKRSLS